MNNKYNIISYLKRGGEKSKNIKKNILGSFIIKGVSIVVQLLLVPLTLGYLSDELYGVWITLSSIVLWMSFFDIGLTLGLKNRLVEGLAKKDYQYCKELVSTTYATLFLIFIPIGIIGELIIPHLNWCAILNISPSYLSDTLISIKVIFICVCLQMIFNAISSVLASYQQVALSNIFTPLGNLISLIVIFFLTKYTEPSLPKLVFSVATIPLLILLLGNTYFFNTIAKDISPDLHSIRFKHLKNIFNIGLGFFFLSAQYVIIYQTINVLISYVSSPIYVTQYNIAHRYLAVAMMIFSIILTPFWPAFTDAYVKKDFPWMQRVYRKLMRTYYFSIISLALMTVASPIVYHIWLRDETDIPVPMTIAVAVYIGLNGWVTLHTNLLNGLGLVRNQVIIAIIGTIVYIPMALGLGKMIGAIGIIYAISIVSIAYAILYTIILRKHIFCLPNSSNADL